MTAVELSCLAIGVLGTLGALCLVRFPAVEHGTRFSRLPGIRCGDLVLFDDPLPAWNRPGLRWRQWLWRLRMKVCGFRVYVVLNAPTPQWPNWEARNRGDGATRVRLCRSSDCTPSCRGCWRRRHAWLRRLLDGLLS